MTKREFLEQYIFAGLQNLNDGFDSEVIWYFSEAEFATVLDRVEKFGLGIMGIEPWLDGEYYSVLVAEDFKAHPEDARWYRKAFQQFRKKGKPLQYAASYAIPEDYMIEE
jgi:hypothetical protein